MPTTTTLAALIGAQAVDETGRSLGRVHDVRMRRDGPVLTPSNRATYRILGLILGAGTTGRRLGYTSPEVTGPLPLTAIFRARGRRSRYAEWGRVAALIGGMVIIRGDGTDLRPVPDTTGQEPPP